MRGVSRWLVLFLALGASACGGSRESVLEDGGQPLEKKGDATPAIEKGDALWKEREDRAKIEGAIAAWQEAAQLDPTRADVQLKLAYAYYFLADAHLRWAEDDAGMLAAYDKGTNAGERAIRLSSPAFAEQIKNGKTWEEAIPSVGKEGLPAMYWYATNLGRWALLDGFTTVLSYKDRVFAIMTHCAKLDEGFWYGGPHRYFGVYYTKIPFPSGDLPKSKEHFEKAVGLAPGYLETKVLFAENYALKASDKALFSKLLTEVTQTPDDANPDLVPETKNSKRKAKKLLDEMADYFD
jgi:tetratricopeptide (TPR) repeat protein